MAAAIERWGGGSSAWEKERPWDGLARLVGATTLQGYLWPMNGVNHFC
uniref:Uncharacterized protein n=1 Tax=Arundo donax TaxID=35708 RepID=A0A0A9B6I4_ARUDO